MASIISAGTTIGTALNMSGDTTGILQLATNGTTTAVTIGTDQKATFVNEAQAKQAVDEAIKKYNEIRIHDSVGRLTPSIAHDQKGVFKKYWKSKSYKIKEGMMKLKL